MNTIIPFIEQNPYLRYGYTASLPLSIMENAAAYPENINVGNKKLIIYQTFFKVAQAGLAALTLLEFVKNQSFRVQLIGKGISTLMLVFPFVTAYKSPVLLGKLHINTIYEIGNVERIDLITTLMARCINIFVNAIHQRLIYGNSGALATTCVHLVLTYKVFTKHVVFSGDEISSFAFKGWRERQN